MSGAWLRDLLRDPARAASFAPDEWNDAIPRLRHARLLARFALDWRARGLVESFPAKIQDILAAAELHLAENRASLEWEIGEIERALHGVPGEIVLLKGASYALAGLPAARGRLTNDVDVLVRRAHLGATQEALEAAGWAIRQEDANERAHFLRWMHQLPAMAHTLRQTAVDVHHAIAPLAGLLRTDPDRMIAASLIARPPRLRVLAPEDMIVMAATHWARERFATIGLRDLLDIADLTRHFAAQDPGFWPKLVARARALGLAHAVGDGLALAARLLGADVPAEILAEFGGMSGRRVALAAVADRALWPDGVDAPALATRLARRALALRATRMQLPLTLMIRRSVRSRWEALSRRPERAS